jgi:adenylate kinase family enzyme
MTNVYLFIGQSGSGKGTQASLLEETIKNTQPEARILHLETGAMFRSLISTGGYTANLVKETMEQGILSPSFVSIHAWSHALIDQYDGQEVLFLDGSPRVPDEVPILLSASKFYKWNLHVIYIKVSDEWANERLVGRGRADDVEDSVRSERLQWFHGNVLPAIEMLKASPEVTFIEINGEQTVPEVQREVCAKLGL